MTYMVKPHQRPMQPASLGGSWTETLNSALAEVIRGEELSCLNTANASAKVKAIDAKLDDLSKNWRPTGFYTAEQVLKLHAETLTAINQARAALAAAVMSTSDAGRQVSQAKTYLERSVTRGKIYLDAVADARSKGVKIIDIPGLRQWVLESLVNVAQAYTTVEVLACHSTWLDTAAAVINKAWAVIRTIVGVVAKIGDAVLKVTDDAGMIWSVVKWGGLATLAAAAIIKLSQMRKGA